MSNVFNFSAYDINEENALVLASEEGKMFWGWGLCGMYKDLSAEEMRAQLEILGNALKRAGESKLQFVKLIDDVAENMPADARVEFFYKPTYVATAVFLYAKRLYPEIFQEQRFADWLEVLCEASKGREFKDDDFLWSSRGTEENLRMFEVAGAMEFVVNVVVKDKDRIRF